MNKFLPYTSNHSRKNSFGNIRPNSKHHFNKKTRLVLTNKLKKNTTLPVVSSKESNRSEFAYELTPDRWSSTGWKYKLRNTKNNNYLSVNNYIKDVNKQLSCFNLNNYNRVQYNKL